jgi:DNA polymerase-3 subunit alpha
MAYLKVYYPLEYFTILLSSSENSPDKLALYSQAANANEIEIIPPDLNKSSSTFIIDKKAIVFGLGAIKGIGYETVNKILTIRNNTKNHEFSDYIDAINRLATGGVGIKVIETLIKAGTFNNLLGEHSPIYLLHNLPEIYEASKTTLVSGEMLIKPKLKAISETKEAKTQFDQTRFELLGISFDQHPMLKIKKQYHGIEKIIDLKHALHCYDVSHVLVILLKYREIKTKTGQAMAFVKIEDNTTVSDAVVFPGVYGKIQSILKNDQIYIITVKANDRGLQALNFKEYHE